MYCGFIWVYLSNSCHVHDQTNLSGHVWVFTLKFFPLFRYFTGFFKYAVFASQKVIRNFNEVTKLRYTPCN